MTNTGKKVYPPLYGWGRWYKNNVVISLTRIVSTLTPGACTHYHTICFLKQEFYLQLNYDAQPKELSQSSASLHSNVSFLYSYFYLGQVKSTKTHISRNQLK